MRNAWWGAVVVLVAAAGCQENKFAPVRGTITVDGQPGRKLFIQFEPLSEGKNLYPGPGSVGRTNDEGVYELITVPDKHPGAVIGKHMVRIFSEGGVDDDELALQGKSINNRKDRPKQLPPKYNNQSELTYDVPAGGVTSADFQLTTK